MIEQKYINVQTHPTLPLTIYNYAGKAMLDNVWNEATINCRGMIVETHTGKIVAQGMKKFFNVGQKGAEEHSLSTLVKVTKKEDGSLGIVYHYDGVYGVATRGSFTSDQALHATALLNTDEYEWLRKSASGDIDTPVVEIVFPGNRIVLNYGDRDELIPLGMVMHGSGIIYSRFVTYDPDHGDAELNRMTFGEALALPIPDDEEGYVLDFEGMEGVIVDHQKLKGEWYKMLHGILTNSSARKIWVMMVAHEFDMSTIPEKEIAFRFGHNPEDFLRVDTSRTLMESMEDTPDEFREWVLKTITNIREGVDNDFKEALDWGNSIKHLEGKERFEAGKHSAYFNGINAYLRSGSTDRLIQDIWKKAYPDGNDLPWITEEE